MEKKLLRSRCNQSLRHKLLEDNTYAEPMDNQMYRLHMKISMFSNTKLFLHNQSGQQVAAAPVELKGFKSFHNPEANSQTYEEYYVVRECLMQHVCRPKPYEQTGIQRRCA